MTEQFIKYLSQNDQEKSLLQRFALLGKSEVKDAFFNDLIQLAEPEIWVTPESGYSYDILFSYFHNTFEKAAKDGLILFSQNEDFACFNTGLLTTNGEDVIALFNKFANKYCSYHLFGFRKESDRQIMENFCETPKVVQYFENPEKIYFNPNFEVIKNLDHILDDNFDRFPEVLRDKGKVHIKSLLIHALDLTIKRCQRNYRIAVPQYYLEKITYLLPVDLDGHKMALAVEEINKRYRANTIFTLDMAYKNARLLMKPEADWLDIRNKNEK